MIRRILLVCGLATALGCAQGGGSSDAASRPPRHNVMVVFDDMGVHPEVARVAQGGTVVWTSHSTEFNGVVSFPLSIAESFTCSELRPIFSKTSDRYESIPVTSDSENVVLPCPLRPGQYDYRINLFSGELGAPDAGMYDPQRSFEAKIVVE